MEVAGSNPAAPIGAICPRLRIFANPSKHWGFFMRGLLWTISAECGAGFDCGSVGLRHEFPVDGDGGVQSLITVRGFVTCREGRFRRGGIRFVTTKRSSQRLVRVS